MAKVEFSITLKRYQGLALGPCLVHSWFLNPHVSAELSSVSSKKNIVHVNHGAFF